MANSKGPSSIRSTMYNGKNPLLPPKSPFPSISPSYSEFIPTIGPKNFQNPRDGNHQRTSSESFLIEEQPSWLDELLDEPETPVRRGGHRRSSSDSFTYADLAGNVGSVGNYVAQDVNRYSKNMMTPASSWGPQDFDIYRDARERSFYVDLNPLGKIKNKPWDAAPIAVPPPRGLPSHRGTTVIQNADRNPSLLAEKQRDFFKSVPQDPKASAEKNDSSHVKYSETDKRAKQQFAQRSRVRKLQYISELERSVQALQAEGTEVSAELEFTNQQIMILSMENKALKQRLESLAQEQLIKYLEHEVLERELGRLRNLYQQQQQQPIMPSSHRRSKSRDFLDQQFANLSLKPKEATTSSARENSHVSGQLHM